MKRVGTVHRKTAETNIRLRIDLDGRGKAKIATGIGFFDHMLNLVARHGAFDLTIEAKGDLDVDQHHTVEDVGIALGEAVAQAIGNKKGILLRDRSKSIAPGFVRIGIGTRREMEILVREIVRLREKR